MAGFLDGVRNFVSSLVDSRNPINQNVVFSQALSDGTLRQLYRHGIANKIVRLKAGHALNDTLQFDTEADGQFYEARLSRHVKKAVKWMLAFGRGVIVLHHPGDNLSKPLGTVDPQRLMLNVFSGDMVTVGAVVLDLQDVRYLRPTTYNVRGRLIHWSRVVDFRYVEPPELDAPWYRYGGISEFELIYEQLIADGIVQRASPRIIEKASTLFYKIRGFKDAMRSGQDTDMINYFQRLEDVRGMFAAGLIDQEDELEVVSQAISNLAEADQITLRRLAMVTSIPLAMLVGENVKGLNSTGDNERQVFQDTIESLQSEYLIDPINELMRKCGLGVVKFKDNQGETAASRIAYDVQAVAVAEKLTAMGEDARGYLIDKAVIKPDAMGDWFPEPGDTFTDSDFDEGNVKRDEGGKFSSTGGGGGAKEKPKHSPEQLAKWAEEKRQREQAQIAERAKAEKKEKEIRQRSAASVRQSVNADKFTEDELRDIEYYRLSGDRAGAAREGAKAVVSAIEREAAANGLTVEHVSESQGGLSKSLYVRHGDEVIRVSDHELPITAKREYDRSRGLTGKWDREIVIIDWEHTPISEYITQIKNET